MFNDNELLTLQKSKKCNILIGLWFVFVACLPSLSYSQQVTQLFEKIAANFHQKNFATTVNLCKDVIRLCETTPEPECWYTNYMKEIYRFKGISEFEIYKKELQNYLRPHLNALCESCRARFETNPLRILDCKVKSCKSITEKAPFLIDFLDGESAAHYKEVKSILDQNQIPYRENLRLVRGLDYYTHTVFEVTSSSLGAQDAICGGGRYNLLAFSSFYRMEDHLAWEEEYDQRFTGSLGAVRNFYLSPDMTFAIHQQYVSLTYLDTCMENLRGKEFMKSLRPQTDRS